MSTDRPAAPVPTSPGEAAAGAAQPPRPLIDDPEYREGVVAILGLLGAGEYLAFERLVTESALAPTLAQRVRVADIAQGELGHFHLLRQRLVELGEDPADGHDGEDEEDGDETDGSGTDAEGLPWDDRIHSSSKKKTAKGLWVAVYCHYANDCT